MKRLKILFISVFLGTFFVVQISGKATTSAAKATQDTAYTAGSNISIDASNQISAVLPAIKVDSSTGAITDSSGKSIEANVFSFATSASIGTLDTLSEQDAGTYLVYKDDYIPKVATVMSTLGIKSYS